MKQLKLTTVLGACALVFNAGETQAQVQTLAPPVVAGAAKARMETIKVHSSEIAGNLLGTPADRDVIVVLPPSYEREPTRGYPVVYALHGYSIGAGQWIKEIHIPQTAEGAFARGTPEMADSTYERPYVSDAIRRPGMKPGERRLRFEPEYRRFRPQARLKPRPACPGTVVCRVARMADAKRGQSKVSRSGGARLGCAGSKITCVVPSRYGVFSA